MAASRARTLDSPPLLTIIALLIANALGAYHADWLGFSGLSEQVQPHTVGVPKVPGTTLAAAQLGQIMTLGWLNVVPAVGEELGWRGYLVRALLPLGQPAAFLVSGILWGLWYAPLLVLGYNYPDIPVVASFLMMICYCTVLGTLLSWLRLTSHSIWPAAIAHGS